MKLLWTACLGAASLMAQGRSTPIDNDQVKVLVVAQDPHKRTGLHKHDVNRVMIYLEAGKQTIEYEDGKKVVLNWKPGQALWSAKSGMHIAEIVSDGKVRIVEIELKKPGGGGKPSSTMDPVKIDAKHNKVEFENDQVRVVRAKFPARKASAMHEHTLNRVTTYITDMDFEVTDAAGKKEHVQQKAGDVKWSSGAVKHKAVNLSDKMCELLVVELK
jgi:quercetin dioxygenase-like cupin family protein